MKKALIIGGGMTAVAGAIWLNQSNVVIQPQPVVVIHLAWDVAPHSLTCAGSAFEVDYSPVLPATNWIPVGVTFGLDYYVTGYDACGFYTVKGIVIN
jgi:hypothetical protein